MLVIDIVLLKVYIQKLVVALSAGESLRIFLLLSNAIRISVQTNINVGFN